MVDPLEGVGTTDMLLRITQCMRQWMYRGDSYDNDKKGNWITVPLGGVPYRIQELMDIAQRIA